MAEQFACSTPPRSQRRGGIIAAVDSYGGYTRHSICVERFSFFELTDEKGAERLDRVPLVAGEIRIGDRGYCKPERLASVCAAGADIIVRAGWKMARWLDENGKPLDSSRC